MRKPLNTVGIVNKEVLIEQPFTGSATLQLAATTTVAPSIGDPFTLVPVGGGTALSCKVSKVGAKMSQDGETKVSIDFRKKIN